MMKAILFSLPIALVAAIGTALPSNANFVMKSKYCYDDLSTANPEYAQLINSYGFRTVAMTANGETKTLSILKRSSSGQEIAEHYAIRWSAHDRSTSVYDVYSRTTGIKPNSSIGQLIADPRSFTLITRDGMVGKSFCANSSR